MHNRCGVTILTQQIDAKLLEIPATFSIKSKYLTAKIANVIVLENGDSGGGDDENMSITYNFTAADLTDGKLTKTHNRNRLVDVSVFNDAGKEIMVGVDVLNLNQFTLDLRRATVNGVWKILVE